MVWLIRTQSITHFPQLLTHILKTALKLMLFANQHLLGMHISLTLPFDFLDVSYAAHVASDLTLLIDAMMSS
jgi:hypothetical protein